VQQNFGSLRPFFYSMPSSVALFEQAGCGSITIYLHGKCRSNGIGSKLPASILSVFLINFFSFLLGSCIFHGVDLKLRSKGKRIYSMKFVLGLLQIAVGFGILVMVVNSLQRRSCTCYSLLY